MSTIKTGVNILFGTYGDKMATILAEQAGKEASISNGGKTWRNILEKDTYINSKKNITNVINNRDKLSIFKNPIQTIKEAYKKANDPAFKTAKELAKEATEKVGEQVEKKGVLGSIQKGLASVGKQLSRIPHVEKLGKFLKGVPLVGAALFMIPEIPTVIKAFKEGGIVNGLKQTLKSTATVGVSSFSFVGGSIAAGFVSQLLFPIPGLGFVLGLGASMIGEKVVSKVFNALSLSPNTEKNEIQANPFA